MTAMLGNDLPQVRPRLRVAPVPSTAPPFDDEVGRRVEWGEPGHAPGGPVEPVAVQGALALAFALPSGVPAVPAPAPRLRVVGRDLTRPLTARSSDPAARPDVARWAAMVVQAAVEVVAGDRPLTQMARWTTPEVYEHLHWRRQRRVARSTGAALSSPRRAVVTSVHICQPGEDVAEACATVRIGERASAVALRLETDRDSWRCTAIALG